MGIKRWSEGIALDDGYGLELSDEPSMGRFNRMNML